MQFQTQLKVVGMKASKGEMEGVTFDSTKIFVEVSLDDSRGNAHGCATAEYTIGTSDEYGKYKHLPCPWMGMADMEIVTSGKAQKTVIRSLKPIEAAKKN